ncbi:MAG: hypothetical protein JWM10_1004 [Myxococcaceae bacterium]|nr:hypothetical protein [Myxococcaceae bacterium]
MRVVNGRRWVRVALVAGVAAAFTSRGEAQQGVAVDVEASPYGGSTSGRLPPSGVCAYSPRVGTAFGGLGARARVRLMDDGNDRHHGLAVTAQAAVEAQSHTLLAPGSDGQVNIPRDQAMAGGSLAVGYDWRYVGLQLGVGAREYHDNPDSPCTTATGAPSCIRAAQYTSTRALFYPDVALRVGRAAGFHVDAGFGAYTPAVLLRPAGFMSLGYATNAGHELAIRCSAQAVGSGDFSPRIDLSGAWPIGRRVIVGAGVAAVSSERRVDVDGRASVTLRFGP